MFRGVRVICKYFTCFNHNFINYFKFMTDQSIVTVFIFLNVLEKKIIIKFHKI